MDVLQRYGSGYGALSGLAGNPLYPNPGYFGAKGTIQNFTGGPQMAANFANLMTDPTIYADWLRYSGGISLATAQKVLSQMNSLGVLGTVDVLDPNRWIGIPNYNQAKYGPKLGAKMAVTNTTPDGSIMVIYQLLRGDNNYSAEVVPIPGRSLTDIVNSDQLKWYPPVLHSSQHGTFLQFLTAVALAVGGIYAASTYFPPTSTPFVGPPPPPVTPPPFVGPPPPVAAGLTTTQIATGVSTAGGVAKAVGGSAPSVLSTGASQADAFNLPTNPSLTPTGFDASGAPSMTPSIPGLLPTAGAAIQAATPPASSGFNWASLLAPASSAYQNYSQAASAGAAPTPTGAVATPPASGVPSLLIPLGIGAAVLALVLFNR